MVADHDAPGRLVPVPPETASFDVLGPIEAAIARRLGMSRRSVTEHMRRVSEQPGSNCRAQLGCLVATSGLLSGLLEA
ncbi:hypothetical protein ACFXPV_15060 [Streptomyces sp. NPDC059118]|uniref:hypothetical protein n=1 Tax=unclassified Streptomyces TaxID=2593676 RepID=UPI0036D09CB3